MTAAEANARERLLRLARLCLVPLVAGLAWGFFDWPDAQRIPAPCKVVGHVQPYPGKSARATSAHVRVEVGGDTWWFPVASSNADQDEARAAFAPWPVGETRTCFRLPFPSEHELVASKRGSLVPAGVLTVMSAAGVVSLLVRARTVGRRASPDRDRASPYREPARPVRPPPPDRLAVAARGYTRGERVIPAIFAVPCAVILVLWTWMTVTSTGSAWVPGTQLRAALSIGLWMLVFPGLVAFPSTFALFARRGVVLDAQTGLAMTWVGIPGLRFRRWWDLSPAASEGGHGSAARSIELPTHLAADDRARVEAWLVAYREWLAT